MRHSFASAVGNYLSAGLLIGSVLIVLGPAAGSSRAQAATENEKPPAAATPGSSTGVAPKRARPFTTRELTPSARKYYQSVWGVDILGVKPVSSGMMLRFSYRVVDANRAKTLNDKGATPLLIDQKTGASLVVPTMEKVGQLRQTSPPENGHEYWMLFSNKGNLVKPGSRVDVVIGTFRASGLMVQPL